VSAMSIHPTPLNSMSIIVAVLSGAAMKRGIRGSI
jgi:hypothetical protein